MGRASEPAGAEPAGAEPAGPFRFHLLGLPHTATAPEFSACAYTAKVLKFAKMMARRGHTVLHYGGENSTVVEYVVRFAPPGFIPIEHVDILTADERAAFFGPPDFERVYAGGWEPELPYWRLHNERIIEALRPRVQERDFILSLCGTAQTPVAFAFPGSSTGNPSHGVFVEYGIGYYGVFSAWRCFESHGHREWIHGKAGNTLADYNDAVIPNYFDADDFTIDVVGAWLALGDSDRARLSAAGASPGHAFYLFVGRITPAKGWTVAVEVCADIGATLILAGQGDPGDLPAHARHVGHIAPAVRRYLFAAAVASFAPTQYREPFGGVAVESQLSGCPCITSDHGAFVETVGEGWRCASHREYVAAALAACAFDSPMREGMRNAAIRRWSLEAVAPLYERYFQRVADRWGEGWYAGRAKSEHATP